VSQDAHVVAWHSMRRKLGFSRWSSEFLDDHS
jgi:hypothetical protein